MITEQKTSKNTPVSKKSVSYKNQLVIKNLHRKELKNQCEIMIKAHIENNVKFQKMIEELLLIKQTNCHVMYSKLGI